MAHEKMVRKPHVLVFPHGTKGHALPCFTFAAALAKHDVTVSFVSYEAEVVRLTPQLRTQNLTNLQFISLSNPDDVTSPQTDGICQAMKGKLRISEAGKVQIEAAAQFRNAFEQVREKLIRDHEAGKDGLTCIVADMFNSWTEDLAAQLQIPRYVFFTSAAALVRMIRGGEDLFVQGKYRVNPHDNKLEIFSGTMDIPGLPGLRYNELGWFIRNLPLGHREVCREMSDVDGTLMNTFYELERTTIDELRKPENNMKKVQKFYPVGPMFMSAVSFTNSSLLEDSQEECVCWLDSQPESSVLYICFGSQYGPESGQIKNLALGLEKSKQRFLWVVQESDITALPPGFTARCGDVGCFVRGWAPQIKVLSHPSTAAYLTHCGWNSCLEGVSLGVPLIGWPIDADQHLNCRVLVDLLKVATEIRKEEDGFEEQKEVERAVQLLMVDEGGKAMKSRAKEFKLKAAAAMGVGGHSSLALEEFVTDISKFKK